MIQTSETLRNYDRTFRSYEDKLFCLQTFLSSAEPTQKERIALYRSAQRQLFWIKLSIQKIAEDFMSYETSIVHLSDPEWYRIRTWVVAHGYLFAERRMFLLQEGIHKIIRQIRSQIPRAERIPLYQLHRPTLDLTMREIVHILEQNPPTIARELTGDDLPLSSSSRSSSKRNSNS